MTIPDELVQRFLQAVQRSWADGSFVRLVIRPRHGAQAPDAPRRITGRLIQLHGQPHLSLTAHHTQHDRTWNLPLEQALDWLAGQLQSGPCNALLGTTQKDWQWQSTPQGPRLIPHRPSQTRIPPRSHDQPKASWLGPSAQGWLRALGLIDAQGRPFPSLAAKYHQIERYLEILSHQARACGWLPPPTTDLARTKTGPAQIPSSDASVLVAVDVGCGKGYLTFALWHLLHRIAGRAVRVLGIDRRSDLIASARQAAESIGAVGLEFICGDIAHSPLPPLDILVALHACNTATDAALRRGIEQGARLILVAPCCHQEVRPQLRAPPLWAPLLRHGLLAERFAEWITDGLRVLFLEWAGYEVKAIEFVPSEHTPKNLLLAAVRKNTPFANLLRRDQIQALKQQFGIQHHALDPLLQSPPATTPLPSPLS